MAVEQQAGLVTVGAGRFAVTGELSFTSVPALWARGSILLQAGGGALELDLSAVDRADSAGLALLVAWQAWAQSAGRSLRYTSVPERLLAIARISEADSLLVG